MGGSALRLPWALVMHGDMAKKGETIKRRRKPEKETHGRGKQMWCPLAKRDRNEEETVKGVTW